MLRGRSLRGVHVCGVHRTRRRRRPRRRAIESAGSGRIESLERMAQQARQLDAIFVPAAHELDAVSCTPRQQRKACRRNAVARAEIDEQVG